MDLVVKLMDLLWMSEYIDVFNMTGFVLPEQFSEVAESARGKNCSVKV